MADDHRDMEEGGLRDRGVTREVSDGDLDDHALSNHRMVIGVRLPRRPKRPKKKRSGKDKYSDRTPLTTIDFSATTLQAPTEAVQSLLGEVDDEQHQPHPIFCQLDLLNTFGGTEKEWREYARWVKYEEDLEEGGQRWSKPHVASLSLHALFELRSTILDGAVLLDLDAYHLQQINDIVIDHFVANKMLEEELREEVRATLNAPHVFAHQKKKRMSSLSSEKDIKKALSKRINFCQN